MTNRCKLFIGGLSYESTRHSLEEAFSKYGIISKVDFIRGRGFGYVIFENPDNAKYAMEAMDGKTIDGRVIHVLEVVESSGRSSGFRGSGGRGFFRGGRARGAGGYRGERSNSCGNGSRCCPCDRASGSRVWRCGSYGGGGGCSCVAAYGGTDCGQLLSYGRGERSYDGGSYSNRSGGWNQDGYECPLGSTETAMTDLDTHQ